MNRPAYFLILFFFPLSSIIAQSEKEKDSETVKGRLFEGYGAETGADYGRTYFIQLGMGRYYGWRSSFMDLRYHHINSVSMLYNPWENIYGVKASFWTSNILGAGISSSLYTDFNRTRLAISPEIGFGNKLRILFGYNILIGNKNLTEVNKTYFSVRYLLPLKKRIKNFDMPREQQQEIKRL